MPSTKKSISSEKKKDVKLVKPEGVVKKNKTQTNSVIKKHKKKNFTSYSSFIYKVLKQVHSDAAISTKAMEIMNSFVQDVMEQIATEAGRLSKINKKSTLGSREIHTACRLVLPGEIAKHAISEGTKATEKYFITQKSTSSSPNKKASKSSSEKKLSKSSPSENKSSK